MQSVFSFLIVALLYSCRQYLLLMLFEHLITSLVCFISGYMIHESVVWSNVHKKFVFLPRRVSSEIYDETADERRASNTRIMADDSFSKIEVDHVGPLSNTRGFSSFKFVPGTKDNVIVALKSEEDNGKIASYITAFTMSGDVLVTETLIGDIKYEGIEFV